MTFRVRPHVFQQGQHMFLLYQIYDPSRGAISPDKTIDRVPGGKPKNKNMSGGAPIRVLTNLELLSRSTKALETPLVVASRINLPQQNGVGFLFDVPLAKLAPGIYTCQINVIDDAAGTFSFPRVALLVRPDTAGVAAVPSDRQDVVRRVP